MKILVCIKEIQEPSSAISINPDQSWVAVGHTRDYRMNRYDEYALEEAILIKESHPNVTVDVVSVGPERIKGTLQRALGKGADDAIHITIPGAGYMDARTVSALIAGYAAPLKYDLILAGVMAEDDMQCIVGPLIAAALHIPCATSVIKVEFDISKPTVTVHCEMEGGMSEKAVLELPALLTIQSGINLPRYPSLYNMLRAKKQNIATISSDTFFDLEKESTLFSISLPKKIDSCKMIAGSTDEKAETLLSVLRDNALLK